MTSQIIVSKRSAPKKPPVISNFIANSVYTSELLTFDGVKALTAAKRMSLPANSSKIVRMYSVQSANEDYPNIFYLDENSVFHNSDFTRAFYGVATCMVCEMACIQTAFTDIGNSIFTFQTSNMKILWWNSLDHFNIKYETKELSALGQPILGKLLGSYDNTFFVVHTISNYVVFFDASGEHVIPSVFMHVLTTPKLQAIVCNDCFACLDAHYTLNFHIKDRYSFIISRFEYSKIVDIGYCVEDGKLHFYIMTSSGKLYIYVSFLLELKKAPMVSPFVLKFVIPDCKKVVVRFNNYFFILKNDGKIYVVSIKHPNLTCKSVNDKTYTGLHALNNNLLSLQDEDVHHIYDISKIRDTVIGYVGNIH